MWDIITIVVISAITSILILKYKIIAGMDNVVSVFYKPHEPTKVGFCKYEDVKRRYWHKHNYDINLLSFQCLYIFILLILCLVYVKYFPVKSYQLSDVVYFSCWALIIVLFFGLGAKNFILFILAPFGIGYLYGMIFESNQIYTGISAILIAISIAYGLYFGKIFHLMVAQYIVEIKTRKTIYNKRISMLKRLLKIGILIYLMGTLAMMVYQLLSILSNTYGKVGIISFILSSKIFEAIQFQIISLILLINISIFIFPILISAVQVDFFVKLSERIHLKKVNPNLFELEEGRADEESEKISNVDKRRAATGLTLSPADRVLGDLPFDYFKIALIYIVVNIFFSILIAFSIEDITTLQLRFGGEIGFPLSLFEIISLSIMMNGIYNVIGLIRIGALLPFSKEIENLFTDIQKFFAKHEYDYVNLEDNLFLRHLGGTPVYQKQLNCD